uniref:DNA-directed RNA polymerase n=1 Tax=viral metagenome TaxID=1070528 RepID=A0A6C0HTD3_9ZZZZ
MNIDNQYGADQNAWDLLSSYYDDEYLSKLVKHQLESYNNFVNIQIYRTIEMFSNIKVASEQDYSPKCKKHNLVMYLSFDNFTMSQPQIHENNGAIKMMFPQEARLRNFTYSSMMSMDINVKIHIYTGENLEIETIKYKKMPSVHIGKMPIMVGSSLCVLKQYSILEKTKVGECPYDTGGYFIINGSEKTVIAQERAAENKIYCFNISKNNTKYSWVAEIKSTPSHKCISTKQINIMYSSKDSGGGHVLHIQIPRLKQPVPLFIVFRALGVISDKKICEKILDIDSNLIDILQGSIIEANTCLTKESALLYLTNYVMYTPINVDKETGQEKKHEFVLDILSNDLFPHCNTVEKKCFFLGYMVKYLIVSLTNKKEDDRDSYLNKRVDCCGVLINNLFRNYLNKTIKDAEKQIIREINTGSWKSTDDYLNIVNTTNIYKIIKSSTIENGIKRALSTGDFGLKHVNSNKVGVAQVLNRLSYVATISHLRRVSTPLDKSGKMVPPRLLNNTSWGLLCPAETPEGLSVGVVKNLSCMAHVSIFSASEPLLDIVGQFILPIEETVSIRSSKVFINGAWIGTPTIDPHELYLKLKNYKRRGIINIYTSVVFNYQKEEIRICNDAGRLMRPLLIVDKGKTLLTDTIIKNLKEKKIGWNDLFTDISNDTAVLEYIDAEEQNNSFVACTPLELNMKHTHCEIHPTTIFGVLASCIPFPEHNQSPRNTYQCAMGKQAIGIYAKNYLERMDKTAYVLSYPARPLTDTRLMNLLKLHEIPSGSNITVAIMSYTGYNQEDSLLVNKGSIDRGLFQATVYNTEKDEDKQKINGEEELRCKPDIKKTKSVKFANYDKIQENGLVPENTFIQNRDIIIAKVIPIKGSKTDVTKTIKYEDNSRVYRKGGETYIDRNHLTKNGDGYNIAKVRLRTIRQPTIGDKFSSRHGQKGTIGNVIPESDMPFTADGIRPDIIINPHAIPSRMTIGQLKEMLLGKVSVELGLFGDGTSFGELHVNDISDTLLSLGYEKNGNDILYDGNTGEQIKADIFIGSVFYQRLKHMVDDKIHSRSIGPMVNLTRQPAEGRSRDGGLRFGEMERDCSISHGAARFTKERMYDVSDKYEMHTCNLCGLIASYNDVYNIHMCKTCENRTEFSRVKVPYSCKLLTQELITMNVVPRFITEKN